MKAATEQEHRNALQKWDLPKEGSHEDIPTVVDIGSAQTKDKTSQPSTRSARNDSAEDVAHQQYPYSISDESGLVAPNSSSLCGSRWPGAVRIGATQDQDEAFNAAGQSYSIVPSPGSDQLVQACVVQDFVHAVPADERAPSQETTLEPSVSEPSKSPNGKKSMKRLLILVLISLIVIGGLVVGLVVAARGDSSPSPASNENKSSPEEAVATVSPTGPNAQPSPFPTPLRADEPTPSTSSTNSEPVSSTTHSPAIITDPRTKAPIAVFTPVPTPTPTLLETAPPTQMSQMAQFPTSSPTPFPTIPDPTPNGVTENPTLSPAHAPTSAPTIPAVIPTVMPTLPPSTVGQTSAPTLGQPTYCGYAELLDGYDLQGSDTTTPIPMGDFSFDESVEICRNVCTVIPYCEAFTLVDTGRSSNLHPWCFIKDEVPSATPATGITSGVRTSERCSVQRSNYEELPSTDFEGNDLFLPCISLPPINSLPEAASICGDICSQSSVCQGYTAVDPHISIFFSDFACCLKRSIPSLFEEGAQPLAFSGIKI